MEESLKAWHVTCPNIVDEPWHYDDIIVYAESRNKAKAKAWSKNVDNIRDAQVPNEDYNYRLPSYFKNRDIQYKDLRAKRKKSFDKIFYNNKTMKQSEFHDLKWCEKRNEHAKSLVENFPELTAVVWNGSYKSYWGPNHAGYATDIIYAGLYSTKEAYDIVKNSDYSRQEEVRLISKEDFNDKIDKAIHKLQENIEKLNACRK